MKRISKLLIAVLLALNTSGVAYAGTCETKLMPLFTANQATKLCQSFGSAVNSSLIPAADNTYDLGSSSLGWRTVYGDTSVITPLVSATADLTLQTDADAQRILVWSASSDTQLDELFGDASTGGQRFEFRAQTANAADSNVMCLTGGGDCEDHARGSFLYLAGADAGGANAGDIYLGSTDDMFFQSGTGGNIALKLDDSGVLNFTPGTAAGRTLTWGDGGTTATQALSVLASTSDADDDSTLNLAGGGAVGPTRGASLVLAGADVGGANAGDATLNSSDDVIIKTGTSGTQAVSIDESQNIVFAGTFIGTGTSTLGWTVQNAANQACTTTCVTPCVFGMNTGALGNFVLCSDATADTCVCAGAS